MRFFRSARTRWFATALALVALVAQAFVLAEHAAARAASKAEQSLMLADLAKLGLTLDDLPCHAAVADPGAPLAPGGTSAPAKPEKSACPVCTLNATSPAVAILSEVPAAVLVLAGIGVTPIKAVSGYEQTVHLAQPRGPPSRA